MILKFYSHLLMDFKNNFTNDIKGLVGIKGVGWSKKIHATSQIFKLPYLGPSPLWAWSKSHTVFTVFFCSVF